MAATTNGLSRTFAVGVGSTNIDVLDAFGRRGIQTLVLSNLSDTAMMAISIMGGAAALNGDDMLHIGPMGQRKIAWRDSFSAIASVAGNLEVARDDASW